MFYFLCTLKMKIVRTTYLSLGSNLGNKQKYLQIAVEKINEKIGHVTKVSSIYKTKSLGFEGDDFFNICIEVSTNLNPESLIKRVLQIETSLGRERLNTSNYHNRNIDIDILLFDDDVIFYNDSSRILSHG